MPAAYRWGFIEASATAALQPLSSAEARVSRPAVLPQGWMWPRGLPLLPLLEEIHDTHRRAYGPHGCLLGPGATVHWGLVCAAT